MAIIKLSEIPNAPQGVANMTMNPQYAGDQVGGAAKADIARGFEGLMQNPQNAGLIGRATASAGNDIISGGGNLASGMLYNAKGKDRQAEAEGMATYYANKTKVEDEYYSRINNPDNPIPVESRPAVWLDVTQKGARFLEGMPSNQQHVFAGEAIKDFNHGVASTANEVHTYQKQLYATNQLTQFQTALTGKDWQSARGLVESGVKTGAFSPEDGVRFETSIKTNEQFNGILDALQADKTGKLWETIKSTGEAGGEIKGAPNVSSENLVKLGKVGEAIHLQNVWNNNVEPLNAKMDAKEIIDPKQLQSDPLYKSMPKEQQDAALKRLTNNRAGTTDGEAYTNAGQDLVSKFPADKGNKAKEFMDIKTWITAEVPEPAASAQIKAITEKYQEMANNGGNLKPETAVMTNASQYTEAILDSGRLYDEKFSEIGKKVRDGSASKEELSSYLKLQAIKNGILERVRAKGPQSDADAIQIINEATRNIRATNPKTEGMLWWKKAVPAPQIKVSDSSNPVIKVAGTGTTFGYKGDPNMDSNTARRIGDHDNKLADGSVGFSREIKKQISEAGIKKGDPIILHFEDGTKVAMRNDDTTDKGLTGRVDFYNPSGPQKNPYEGKKIIGVQKA
jgi:hypothetical protein